MKIVRLSEVSWEFKERSGVNVGRSDLLPSNPHADIVYAEIPPGMTLYRHFHIRPTIDGFVSCFFLRGGRLELLGEGDTRRLLEFDEPVHITFYDREIHGIKNVDDKPLIFEVISAPRFIEGEEVHVEEGE